MSADDYVKRRLDLGEKGLAVTCFCAYVEGGRGGTVPSGRRSPAPGHAGSTCHPTATSRGTRQYAGQGYRLHQIQAYADLYSADLDEAVDSTERRRARPVGMSHARSKRHDDVGVR